MNLRLSIILAISGLILTGTNEPGASAEVKRADGPTVVVTASYAGATADFVVTTLAKPIEICLVGTDGMEWMESESCNDGSYIARIRFAVKTDPRFAVKRIQDRVHYAAEQLPSEVKPIGVAVKIGAPDGSRKPVAIALVDRGNRGRKALQQWSAAVLKRFMADEVAVKPEAFPSGPDVKHVQVLLDRAKCAEAGVLPGDVTELVRTAGPGATINDLKMLKIRSAGGAMIPLRLIATFEEGTGPTVVYRVNFYPAIRIAGLPPKDKTPAEAAARSVELAEAERPQGFRVENLTGK